MTESSRGEQTRNIIRQAIIRIEKGRPKVVSKERKISVAAVAEEAGVSRATIHNNYPDMADHIRATLGKQNRIQRDKKHEALQLEKAKNRQLRTENAELRTKINVLVSKNRALTDELHQTLAIAGSANVSILKPTSSTKRHS
ncbi:TetR family transcriptional regulator [Methylophaga thalassica]|uniref:TetR family transcriptional regulator n=1 Tax=Methylophaga thalassica TaxID=40223 RepID=UPI002E7AEE23|nr:TetR family transcriptional regulator [Methylophaga thalassica]WVI83650.1 TetR family transcriptional regulator [Methylophaga thalassica]